MASIAAANKLPDNIDKPKPLKSHLDQAKTNLFKIWTTELMHQDPTSPMENKDMTAVIAQITSVEKQEETTRILKELVDLTKRQSFGNPISYLGSEITTDSGNANLKDGKAVFAYNLPSDASDVVIQVMDKNSKIIHTSEGTGDAGYNEYVWDGLNEEKISFPEDNYSIVVKGKKSNSVIIPQENNKLSLGHGEGKYHYYIPEGYNNTSIVIKDEDNKILHEKKIVSRVGEGEFSWDGKNKEGKFVKNGEYKIEVRGVKPQRVQLINTGFTADEFNRFPYEFEEYLDNISVSIKDNMGNEVFKRGLDETKPGSYNFDWDCKDNNGVPLEKNKLYNIEISGVSGNSASNTQITANTKFKGIVTGVDTTGNDPLLEVGGVKIPFDKVKSFSLPNNDIK